MTENIIKNNAITTTEKVNTSVFRYPVASLVTETSAKTRKKPTCKVAGIRCLADEGWTVKIPRSASGVCIAKVLTESVERKGKAKGWAWRNQNPKKYAHIEQKFTVKCPHKPGTMDFKYWVACMLAIGYDFTGRVNQDCYTLEPSNPICSKQGLQKQMETFDVYMASFDCKVTKFKGSCNGIPVLSYENHLQYYAQIDALTLERTTATKNNPAMKEEGYLMTERGRKNAEKKLKAIMLEK